MNVLVLGGSGFIGSHVVDALVRHGHRVTVLSRNPRRVSGPMLPGVEYVSGNYEETERIGALLGGVDVVFHGVSTTVPSSANADPIRDIESNLVATVRLLDAMLERGVTRVIFLSSGGTVYGRTNVDAIPESHPMRPICSYGIVKATIEHYLGMYQSNGLRPTILRPSNPYGERQGNTGLQGVVGTFLSKVLAGQPVTIWGDGSVVRDYIYVRDLARACVMAMESGDLGTFNIGSGEGLSLMDVLACVRKVSGEQVAVEYREARSFDVEHAVLDISKAKETFGWGPEMSFEEGVDRQWQWLREGKPNG